jgi:hypothetical protein
MARYRAFPMGNLGWSESLLYGERGENLGLADRSVFVYRRTRFRNASILAIADFDRSFGNSVNPCAPPG